MHEAIKIASQKDLEPDRIGLTFESTCLDEELYVSICPVDRMNLNNLMWRLIKEGFKNSEEQCCECGILGINKILSNVLLEPVTIVFTTISTKALK